jgi:hypothetical protein
MDHALGQQLQRFFRNTELDWTLNRWMELDQPTLNVGQILFTPLVSWEKHLSLCCLLLADAVLPLFPLGVFALCCCSTAFRANPAKQYSIRAMKNSEGRP